MKRTAFARPDPSTENPWRRAQPLTRTPMKKRSRKRKPGDDKRMRDACRAQPCYLQIPGICTGLVNTVVPAHRNEGKGAGLKNPDVLTVPGCGACHFEYDQGNRFVRDEKRALFDAAYARWSAYRDRGTDTFTDRMCLSLEMMP